MRIFRPKLSVLLAVVALALAACNPSDRGAAESDVRTTTTARPDTAYFAPLLGSNVHIQIQGEGPPVLLIHGEFMDSRMWEPQIDALSAGNRVIRYDLRGFGKTETTAYPFSFMMDLVRVIDAAGEDSVALVGISLGAVIATEFATMFPEKVAGLVLVSSPLIGANTGDPDGVIPAINRALAAFNRGSIDSTVALTLETPYFRSESASPEMDDLAAIMIRDNFGSWMRSLRLANWPSELVKDRLGAIKKPTLIVVGDRGVANIRMAADSLSAGIAGARTVVIPGGGHFVNLDEPQAFNRAVLEFLDSLN